jgi:hypothetical protein
LFIYQSSRPVGFLSSSIAIADFGTPLFSIALSLNVLLTLMIVTRLFLHDRSIRKAAGARFTTSGLYNAIITMLIESCAVYAISFLLYMGPWAAASSVANLFFTGLSGAQVGALSTLSRRPPNLGTLFSNPDEQVIAPFLLILRVANRTALTSDTMISGGGPSIYFGKSMGGSETLPDAHPMSSIGTSGETPGQLSGEAETTIDQVQS